MKIMYAVGVSYVVETEKGPVRLSETALLKAISVSDAETMAVAAYLEEHGGSCDVKVRSVGPSTVKCMLIPSEEVKDMIAENPEVQTLFC